MQTTQNKVTTIELLCALDNSQGGIIHQYTKEYNCTAGDLIYIDEDKIEFIYNMFKTGQNANKFIDVARKYYKKQSISIVDICKMLIKLEVTKLQNNKGL